VTEPTRGGKPQVENHGRYLVDVPVRWSDMDAYGHVNNVQYLRFFEDARIEAFGAHQAYDDGGTLLTHVDAADPDDVVIGMRVRVDFRPFTDRITLPYFVPENPAR